jgi:3-phosphoshikimate 1-carboxyvinyltransferase
LPDLKYDELQADSKFLDLLIKLEAIQITPEGIKVFPHKKSFSVEMNVEDCLDLVPTLGYLLAHIPGRHVLKNVQNLKYKESNRLQETMILLQTFERSSYIETNDLIIEGSSKLILKSIDLIVPNDHRMVMVGALFLKHHSGGTLCPAEAVEKSFANFFSVLGI